ncbi:hypothetical protein PRIPAC_71589 [Pristionchus pacificus]|uniref:Uncharacterized protein n=1 Tax=Pristionchus pacificus TaxID=54126 RepID=A0A2A6CFY1_PRIPA|nr:hypothetical protein PRIPAC_71589 [Pristionchus pacificus]|eukprot:PDM77016.1 hypothetical protein PRIPAC_42411 [Pristionchus pacificus]
MMNEKNDYFRFPLALCPSEKSLTSTFGSWETSPPKKTVSSNAPNRVGYLVYTTTRKSSIAEVDDIVVGGTEAKAGEDFNTWDLITNETNDKEGYDDDDEEKEIILVNRQDDKEIMMCMIQEGFNDVFYH